ncbi:MAG: BON domain-containing protein [Verrucomicrobia bacterium]|nr:BON domain-containing protein [Verrucomicrobiota bacterium]
MRTAFTLLLLGTAVGATFLQLRFAGPDYERDLTRDIAATLAEDARFRDVRVAVRRLDAILTGEVESPADRAEAQELAGRVWGVRARSVDNRIEVRARLDAIVEADASSRTALPLESVSIRGCLPESLRAEDLPTVFSGVSANRRISSSEVAYHSFVGPLPRFDREALAHLAAEFSRLPSIGMIELTARGITLSGDAFPAQKQRLEEIAARAVAPPGRVESQLRTIDLHEPARQALVGEPGLEKVQVHFNEAYATLTGTVATPDLRMKAARLIENIRLARLREDRNLIALGALFSATVRREPGQQPSVHVGGLLPDESWKTQLIASLGRLKPGWTIETGALRFAPSVTPAGWLEKGPFFAFFDEFFALPAPGAVRIDANGLVTQARLTAAQGERLRERTRAFGFSPLQVRSDHELYPSIYHLPEYRPVSTPPEAARESLAAALREAQIHFETGSAEPAPEEAARLDRLVAALAAAGDACSLVVGGHADATGETAENERLSRARAEAVVRLLEARGWPRARCLVESFGSIRAAGGEATEEERRRSRRVEILLR